MMALAQARCAEKSVGDDNDRAVAVELVTLVEQRNCRPLEPVFVEQGQVNIGDDDLFLVDDAFGGDPVTREVKVRRGYDRCLAIVQTQSGDRQIADGAGHRDIDLILDGASVATIADAQESLTVVGA